MIPRRVDIGMRPAMVEAKSRIGDLELNLIIGKGHHGVVLTVVDRKSNYVARPYHSWERGLGEHTNGIAREYWPKWKAFKHLPLEDVQRLLNNRPPKAPGYCMPAEAFQAG